MILFHIINIGKHYFFSDNQDKNDTVISNCNVSKENKFTNCSKFVMGTYTSEYGTLTKISKVCEHCDRFFFTGLKWQFGAN